MTFPKVASRDASSCVFVASAGYGPEDIQRCSRALADTPDHIRIPLTRQLAQLAKSLAGMAPDAAQRARRLAASIDFIEATTRRPLGAAGEAVRALCTHVAAPRIAAVSPSNQRSEQSVVCADNRLLAERNPAA